MEILFHFNFEQFVVCMNSICEIRINSMNGLYINITPIINVTRINFNERAILNNSNGYHIHKFIINYDSNQTIHLMHDDMHKCISVARLIFKQYPQPQQGICPICLYLDLHSYLSCLV